MPQVNMYGRQTGKTCAMLHEALSLALRGESVMVVAANFKSAMAMFEDTARMERPSGVNRTQRRLDYFKGSISFVVNDIHREERQRGYNGRILVDHGVTVFNIHGLETC
jgi:predicted translin family RNA/ssDNA-binding protein